MAQSSKPTYPSSLREFFLMFPDENACLEYLINLRWSGDFVCVKCNLISTPWMTTRKRIYNQLETHGYNRKVINMSDSEDFAHVNMPGVHRIASLLKRWILGTHQGSVGDEHLQSYLEEYTFRFNRRNSRSRGLVFRRLLEHSVIANPVTQDDIVGGYWAVDGKPNRI